MTLKKTMSRLMLNQRQTIETNTNMALVMAPIPAHGLVQV